MICDRAGRKPLILKRTEMPLSGAVHFLHFLHDFEEPGASGNPVCLQRGRDSETDRLLSARGICHNQISGQRVQPPVHTFRRCVKRF